MRKTNKKGRKHFKNVYKKDSTIARVFIDMDGVLAMWRYATNMKDLFEPDYFFDLNVQIWARDILWKLYEKHKGEIEFYILSSVVMSPYAIPEKGAWLDIHFPIPPESRIWVKNGDNKAIYVPGGIKRNDILIDDYSLNLHRWERSGGTGLKLLNGSNGTKGTWDKNIVPEYANFEELEKTILKLIA